MANGNTESRRTMAWDPRTSDAEARSSIEPTARDEGHEIGKRTTTASFPPPPQPPSTPPAEPRAVATVATSPHDASAHNPASAVGLDAEVVAAIALFAEGAAPHETPVERARRLGFGKKTMDILAPLMVRKVARSSPRPHMKLRLTRELVLALALMIAILSSASVALALH
jgi:hypothetical protein